MFDRMTSPFTAGRVAAVIAVLIAATLACGGLTLRVAAAEAVDDVQAAPEVLEAVETAEMTAADEPPLPAAEELDGAADETQQEGDDAADPVAEEASEESAYEPQDQQDAAELPEEDAPDDVAADEEETPSDLPEQQVDQDGEETPASDGVTESPLAEEASAVAGIAEGPLAEDAEAQSSEETIALDAGIIASGTWGTCKWDVDDNAVLTIHAGKGSDVIENSIWESDERYSGMPSWGKYADNIAWVKTEPGVVFPSSAVALFADLNSLWGIDLSGVDASGTLNMTYMFSEVAPLQEIVLGKGFSSKYVTNAPESWGLGGYFWESSADGQTYSRMELPQACYGTETVLTRVEGKEQLEEASHSAWRRYVSERDTSKYEPSLEFAYNSYGYWGGYKYTIALNGQETSKTRVTTVYAGSPVTPDVDVFFNTYVDVSHESGFDEGEDDGGGSPRQYTIHLVQGTDYKVDYRNNTGPGRATVVVTGIGGYTGVREVEFDIVNPSGVYSDCDAGAWYMTKGWVAYAVDHGLMTGYRDAGGNVVGFGPEDWLTRAQVATILYRYANPGSDATSNPSAYGQVTHFSDVARGQYYTAAVEWAYQRGIVTGYSGTTRFGPDDPVTREQLATMMYRMVEAQGGGYSSNDYSSFDVYAPGFSDLLEKELVSDWAVEGMVFCGVHGVITGAEIDGKKYLQPQKFATRAQMAKIVTVVTRDLLRG